MAMPTTKSSFGKILGYSVPYILSGAVGMVGGSMVGAAAAGQTDRNPNIGGAIGAPIGAMATMGVTAIAKHPESALIGIGAPIYGIGRGIYKAASGEAIGNGFEALGEGLGTLAGGIGVLAGKTAAVGAGVAVSAAADVMNIASHLTKAAPEEMLGYKLNGLGGVAIGAFAVGKGIVKGFSAFNKIHQGQTDSNIVRATPQPVYSSMMDNAGATGDLVFALHNNRRG